MCLSRDYSFRNVIILRLAIMRKTRRTPPKARRALRAKSTSQKRTEQALADATQRLRSILIANEVATWNWDIIEDRVTADKNMARLFGIKPKDAAGAPVATYLAAIHHEDRPAVSAKIAEAMEAPDGRFEADYRVVRQDGSTSWVTARGRVERDAKGKPRQLPGVVIDTTARKASEQKAEDLRQRLEEQYRLFDITLSSINDFAYVFDLQGRFVFVNQALLDLWSLNLSDAVGKNFHQLLYPTELANRLQQQIQQVIETKAGLTDETPYTSQTGAGGYYEYIFRPVFGPDGQVAAVAGSTRDITARKQVEADLRESQERLRALAETLENQVRSRTAELEERNNEVLLQSEQLRALSVRLMETQDEQSRRIARELHDSAGQIVAALAMNLGQMTREAEASNSSVLIELAKETRAYVDELNKEIRTTSYLLHPPMLDEMGLRAALAWYVDGLKQRAGLDIHLSIDDDFPRPSREMELTIFRVIQECLTNIHRHAGSQAAYISIARDHEQVLVEVRDDGRGISSQDLKRIREKGSGVGLRGMRERVRPFAGDVRIESQVGVGTTIRVTLPQSGAA
jgi:PAS domain S-box-containing protein